MNEPSTETLARVSSPSALTRNRAWSVARFVMVLAVMYLVYGGVHMLFLRDESAWMLLDVQGGLAGVLQRMRFAVGTSYNGHYTPLFFLLELISAAVCGTSEAWWRLRQLTLLAVLALALWSLFRRMAAYVSPHRAARAWIAAGCAAVFVFSPLVIDLVDWPFMSAQFIWATLTALCLSTLGRAIAEGTPEILPTRTLGWSLAAGYASMHAFGLGLPTMAGWCAVCAVWWLEAWQRQAPAAYLRKLGALGGLGVLLTGLHTVAMVTLMRVKTHPAIPRADLGPGRLAGEALGFVAGFFFAVARSLWGPDAWPYPRADLIGDDWPYGLGIVLALTAAGVCWFRSHRAQPSAASFSRLCWHTFSLAAFFVFVALVAIRVRKGEGEWLNYLIGPRYLWTGSVLLIGFGLSFVMCLRSRDPWLAVACGAALVLGSAAGSVVYQREVVPRVWPYATVSHQRAWEQLVAMTGELRRARLPLPDVHTRTLTDEFDLPLRQFEPGLRHAGDVPPGERFEWMDADRISPRLWRNMLRQSPALAALSETVFAELAASMPPAVLRAGRDAPGGVARLRLTGPDALKDSDLDHVKDHPNLGVDIEIDGTSRRSIWIDAPTSLTFHDVALGAHPVFRAFVAIHPAVLGVGGADGAVFQVDVIARGRPQRVVETYIDPYAHAEQKTWNRVTADLSRFAGQQVDVVLSNSPGPQDNSYADWCIWGDPELTED